MELEFQSSLSSLESKRDKIKINKNPNTIGINKEPISLFGIENFYGNCWKFIDGIYTKDDGYYIAKYPSQYGKINEYTHYPCDILTHKDDVISFVHGYLKEIEKIGLFNLPKTINEGANKQNYYSDKIYSHNKKGINSLIFGGRENEQDGNGIFTQSFRYKETDLHHAITTRILFLP